MAVVRVQRLSDGRSFRLLPGSYTQAHMFELENRSRWEPKTEGIATVMQLGDAINAAMVYQRASEYAYVKETWSRSNSVGFYPRGFERASSHIGRKLVWVENEKDPNRGETGRLLVATFDLSKISGEKVVLADGTETTLKRAAGMGIIPLSKLAITKAEDNQELVAYHVTVASDFDPKLDLSIKDVARPNSWSISVDADGYALNNGKVSDSVGWKTECAMFSSIRHYSEFLDVDRLPAGIQRLLMQMRIKPEDMGWFRSVARDNNIVGLNVRRFVFAGSNWSNLSGVAIVGRHETVTD